MSRRKKITLIAIPVVLVIVALTLFLTTSGTKKVETAESSTTTTTIKVNPSPLTGLNVSNEVKSRPVIMLKIDNSPVARPQAGLNSADVIYEERVEGGLSRFIAMFQTNNVTMVGPIRSVRSTDAAVIDPVNGLFGYSGGIPTFVSQMRATSATDVGFDALPSAYARRKDLRRSSEHTLYVDLTKIRASKLASKGATPPQFFSFVAKDSQSPYVKEAAMKSVSVSMGQTVGSFAWNSQKKVWLRSTDGRAHNTEGTSGVEQISATNVIVQFVPYQSTGQRDPAGSPVDKAVVTGTGSGFALVDGRYVRIQWSKPSSKAVTTYTYGKGLPLKLNPGRTWVSIAPLGARVTKVAVPITTTTSSVSSTTTR